MREFFKQRRGIKGQICNNLIYTMGPQTYMFRGFYGK